MFWLLAVSEREEGVVALLLFNEPFKHFALGCSWYQDVTKSLSQCGQLDTQLQKA